MSISFSRRALLTGGGIAGASLLLPSLFGRTKATAAPLGSGIKRLVIIGTPHGTVYRNWRMRPSGANDAAPFEMPLGGGGAAPLSPILAPLGAFASRMLVLDGLAMASAYDDPGNEHDTGHVHAYTGKRALRTNGMQGTGPSLDQVVAAKIARADRVSSLQIGGGGDMSFAADGRPLPRQEDIRDVFERYFSQPPTETTPTTELRVRAAQGSVLDFVQGEYDQVSRRLSVDDRKRLEVHRDLVRDLEKRVVGLADLRCDRPSVTAESTKVTDYLDATCRLAAATLACDVTRVIHIGFPELPNADFGARAGDVHQDFAHNQEKESAAFDFAREEMTKMHVKYAEIIARFVSLLDGVPDGEGTLLDSTLVLWAGELANGDHSFTPWPAVLLGGGTSFRMGRYLYWPSTSGPPAGSFLPDDARIGVPHNKLLTSIAREFGHEASSFGDSSVPTKNGSTLSLTGTLDRLL